MVLVDTLHDGYVHQRRIRRLTDHLSSLIPDRSVVLDVGCGDGLLARRIQETRPDLQMHGIDVLIREAARAAGRAIVFKDHTRNGLLAGPTLRFMDYVGNAHHGVVLPYNYWPRGRWLEAFRELGLTVRAWKDDLKLYPRLADWVFGRSLHFIALLEPTRPASRPDAVGFGGA